MVRSMKGSHRGRAFSLVEMLIVIGILAVLVGLLLPAVSRARRQANMAACAHNLHEIHNAVLQSKVAAPYSLIAPGGWKATYVKFLSQGQDGKTHPVYSCLEDERRPTDTGDADFADLTVRVFRGTEFWDIALAEGPRCRKLNDTGDTYELWFEEAKETETTNVDWNDLVLKVVVNTDGTITITLVDKGQYHNDLMYLWDATNNVMVWDKIYKAVPTGTVLKTNNFSSYGMNKYINETWGDADKIAVMDYAVSTINPDTDNWSADPKRFITKKTQLSFARHNRNANILYGDGSVRLTPMILLGEYDLFGPLSDTAKKYWYK